MTEPTAINTLADLLAGLQSAAAKARPTPVVVPELGGSVCVMPITADEWLDSDASTLPADASDAHRRAWGVARFVCNEEGQRLVKPDNTDALALFAALPWEASHRILQAAGVLSGEQKNG